MASQTDKPAAQPLRGVKIFVVEDEALISMLLEDILDEFGCEIVGSALTLSQAMDQAKSVPAEVAILDINLGGDPIYPVASVLSGRDIPFVFASGYGATMLPDDWRARPTLAKPFSADQVAEAICKALGRDLTSA